MDKKEQIRQIIGNIVVNFLVYSESIPGTRDRISVPLPQIPAEITCDRMEDQHYIIEYNGFILFWGYVYMNTIVKEPEYVVSPNSFMCKLEYTEDTLDKLIDVCNVLIDSREAATGVSVPKEEPLTRFQAIELEP